MHYFPWRNRNSCMEYVLIAGPIDYRGAKNCGIKITSSSRGYGYLLISPPGDFDGSNNEETSFEALP